MVLFCCMVKSLYPSGSWIELIDLSSDEPSEIERISNILLELGF